MIAAAILAAFVLAFLFGALEPGSGREAAFAAVALCLAVAACIGPFLFTRRRGDPVWVPARRGGLRALIFGAVAAGICAVFAGVHGGPLVAALACGLFCGLYAFALGALADLLRGGAMRIAVAVAGLLALATLFYWDDVFLHGAADRKASAGVAFHLSAAAAASVTLGFDWIHQKGLYTNNQTAESLVQIPLGGIGLFSAKLGILSAVAAGLGLWRRP